MISENLLNIFFLFYFRKKTPDMDFAKLQRAQQAQQADHIQAQLENHLAGFGFYDVKEQNEKTQESTEKPNAEKLQSEQFHGRNE